MIPPTTTADSPEFERYVQNIIATWEAAGQSEDDVYDGMSWYPTAHDLAEMIGHGDARQGAGIIAALSANCAWDRNVTLAQHASEGDVGGHTTSVLAKVTAILGGMDPADVLPEGRKTMHFFRNILDPTDPVPVTIDRHAHDIAVGERYGERDRGLKSLKRYAILAAAYREAARRLDQVPSVVQAVTWVHWRKQSTSNQGE